MNRLRWGFLAAALVAIGCTPQTKFESAILAKVTVPPGSASKCVRVRVKPDNGESATTAPLQAKSELSVAVYQAPGWSARVLMQARGFANCDAATDWDAAVETSDTVSTSFPASGVETVTLALRLKPADADNDGHPAGDDDCDDANPAVFRGAQESCASAVDNNCSGQTGCADLTCTGACGNNGSGQCLAGVCTSSTEVSCTDGQDNDGDLKVDCADGDCANIACSDNNACTTGETCNSSGACAGGTAASCNTPPGACFNGAGTCNPANGVCTYTVRTGSCDDSSACTSSDVCLTDGGCEGTTSVACNAPPSQCHDAVGVCNAQDAGCTYAVRTGACSDGNACTTGESCQTDATCGAPTSTTACATPPGQCFVNAGTCNTQDGGCSYAVRAGTCDDANACTTGEQCLADGGCGTGTAVVCNTPPDQCSQATGTCSTTTGQCVYAPRSGGCNDSNACTSGETCNAAGVCTGGMGTVTCTTPPGQCYSAPGACIPADAGCTYTVRTGTCDDNNLCTTGETCQTDGTCGAPTSNVTCQSPPNACFTATGSCNPASGACAYSLRPGNNNPCDDGNACTAGDRCLGDGGCGNPTTTVTCSTPPGQCFTAAGTCNPSDAGCGYPVRAGACDDGNPCTTGEQCLVDGGCGTGTTVVCNAPPSSCHGSAGTCQASDGGCSYPVLTGNACNDTNACSSGETCQMDGTCGAPTSTVTCSAPPTSCFNAVGTCDAVDAGCSYTPKGGSSPCDDNNACTTGERCVADGGCANATSTVTCATPPGQCFTSSGTCNPADATCSYATRTGACDDGNPCTTGEQCLGDGGCGAGAVLVCNTSPGQCFSSAGTCQVSDGGCSYPVLVSNVCNDGNACTLGETCQGDGSCGSGTLKSCAAPAQCFDAGVCQPADGGCTYSPAPSGDSCTDGNLCTSADTCNGSGVCSAGAPVSCTAPNPCFDGGTCSPATGCPVPAPMPGKTCSDTDPCTFGEACNAAGVCTPSTTTTCAPNECQTGGTCLTDAGCSFNNRQNGFNCNSGNGDCFNGICVTPTAFPYTPRNFAPDTSMATSYLTIDCPLTIDTSGPTPTFTTCRPATEQVTPEVITQTTGGKEAVVLHVADMQITDGGSLTVTGARPLIIAVYGNATINGTIDVSAATSTSGPGAGLDCPTTTPTSGTQNTGASASGSGGAGNTAVGGNGGAGDGTATVGQGGAVLLTTTATLQPLVGGCRGANGAGTLAALGGGGGGAVQISAAGTLLMRGRIAAAGGGGAGAESPSNGGAGGGSAGGILLQGVSVTLKATAILTANGGSGGEGSSITTVGGDGVDGPKFTKARATTPDSSPRGGNGGQGGGATVLAGANGGPFENSNGGGGGGGGAAGRIHIDATGNVCRETNHIISPSLGTGTTMNEGSPAFTITAGGTNTTGATCP